MDFMEMVNYMKIFFEFIQENQILTFLFAILTIKKIEIDPLKILKIFSSTKKSNYKKILNPEERKINFEEAKNRTEECQQLADTLSKLKPLELKESPPSIVCPNDTETVNDVILALARLTDFLQDEAEHMQPIRRMAFILLKQTWKSYVVGIAPKFEHLDVKYINIDESKPKNQTPNKKQKEDAVNELNQKAKESNKKILNDLKKTNESLKSNKTQLILKELSKTLMRGLLTKTSPKEAKLAQEIFRNQLDDLFFIGLDTRVTPDIVLVIEEIDLHRMNLSYSNLENMIFKKVNLFNANFQAVVFEKITFEDVNFTACIMHIFSDFESMYQNGHQPPDYIKFIVNGKLEFKMRCGMYFSSALVAFTPPRFPKVYLCRKDKMQKPEVNFHSEKNYSDLKDVTFYCPEKNGQKLIDLKLDGSYAATIEKYSEAEFEKT